MPFELKTHWQVQKKLHKTKRIHTESLYTFLILFYISLFLFSSQFSQGLILTCTSISKGKLNILATISSDGCQLKSPVGTY